MNSKSSVSKLIKYMHAVGTKIWLKCMNIFGKGFVSDFLRSNVVDSLTLGRNVSGE